MHIVWKRPDGFHKAKPSDYKVVDVDSHARIWLHQSDSENYPFRVSGGWEDEEATARVNSLVNLIPKESKDEWTSALEKYFANSKQETFEAFVIQLQLWLGELKKCAKGDTWEVAIIQSVLNALTSRLSKILP